MSVGVRYVFGGAERPDLWVAIGPAEPNAPTVDEGLARQADGIGAELARVDRALAEGSTSGFTLVEQVTPGVFARLAERVLAFLARRFG